MKRVYLQCSILLILLFLQNGCKKYEEDEFISLRGPKKRLKIWSPFNSEAVRVNGRVVDGAHWTFGFEKDGDFRWVLTTENDSTEAAGSWGLSDDKDAVILEYQNGGSERWRIEKLYRKELIMTLTRGGNRITFEGKGF